MADEELSRRFPLLITALFLLYGTVFGIGVNFIFFYWRWTPRNAVFWGNVFTVFFILVFTVVIYLVITKLQDRVRTSQTRLEELTTRLQLALEGTDTGIWELDLETNDVFWDKKSQELFGYSEDEFEGRQEDFRRRVHPEDLPVIQRELERARETARPYNATFRVQLPDGTLRWIEAQAQIVKENGKPRRIVGIHSDITDVKRIQQQLEQLSRTDSLTGLHNKRFLTKRFNEEWNRANRSDLSLGLIMLDLDRFKEYNDEYGHVAGDRALESIGNVIQNSLKRPSDLAARFGGEEFVALLPETGEEGAFEVAENIRTSFLEEEIEHNASDVAEFLTVSAGVAALIPDQQNNEERLLELADQALYHAKSSGRNCVKGYSNAKKSG